ncbi:neuroblast differentiation-associated protein AHNAK isoform X2 [Anarrhichthys ocellatus]|nr:neuroblast differentiation-associated protein AHNAK-like isoform X2 [Anarrhichthys ocellatus]XP_031729048.1 neuroblast differentiation-associated protein AHNAK-like isoform X2 [Anarrhichthys ocellatus]
MFEKRSTPKMSKLKEDHSPESGVIVKTAPDGCSEGLVYGGGGREGIFIKEVVPESPASKSLKLKEGDQILSATVYFDNVSYEDAVQILEHAQAYKMKLCLKRNPGVTETESAIESDVIPEEDVYVAEMREQGKTKRRSEARISWPKFPSFGKGRKSRFTRSHSSSEADEQRKLELSPTTSDTESPIKSQDTLKGKKKHKIKLSGLTKRGRISSSEDQDTDAPTSAQMLPTECLESPSGETPQVYVTEDLKVVEDLRLTEPQTVQHKVELISIASTLKTEDLTVALAGQESLSGIKSPDGKKKKKKKELSQLKINILGKDKSHKKDAKEKSSPKRLKTMGASIEIADQPENEKSDVIPSFESRTKLQGVQLALDDNTQIIERSVPKMELEISDVAFIQKSPQKGEEKTKKGKDIKQKQEAKRDPTFKLPKIGFSDIASEETIPKMNVNFEERTTKIEQLTTEGTEVKEDPFEQLSKSSLSRTKLPKREDIEIPGMEDMSKRTTVKIMKEPKTVSTRHYEDTQAETVQMSIDVDSVKEAVSKLPGFKLPKVDTSGMPIPEEITVIDANAQRISVKTPTKTKHEAHFSKFDITASPEISKTTIKLPKITPADLASDELLMVTQVDLKKTEKEYKAEPKQSDKEVYKREHIIIPGKESAQEATVLQTQGTQDNEGIKSDYISAATFKTKRAKITMPSFGIAKPDIKIPDIGIHLPKQNISEQNVDNIKGERTIFLQEVEISKTEARNKIGGVTSDVKIPEIDGIEYIDSAYGSPAKKDVGFRLTGFGVNLNADSPKADISCTDVGGEAKVVEAKEQTFKLAKFGEGTLNINVNVPDANEDINIDGAKIKTLDREEKGGKFHLPNLGISMPKVKGPTIDISLSKQDVNVTLPEAKAEVKLPEAPDSDITLGTIDVSNREQKIELEKPEFNVKHLRTEGELDGQGGKFKMPEFGVKMPKVKGPEFDLSLSKKDVDVTLPQAKAEVKLPYVEHTEPGIKIESKAPEIAIYKQDIKRSTSKFKMPTFKLPTVGVGTPNVSVEVRDMDKDVKIDGANRAAVNIEAPSVDIEGPSVDMKAIGTDHEGKESKLKMPHLGFTMPKVKGPQVNLSSSKKDVDVTLPEAKAEVKLPDVKLKESSAQVEIKAPEIEAQTSNVEGSPSKLKMPTFTLPKFGAATPKVSVEVPDVDKDIKIEGATVDITAPRIDTEGLSVDMKSKESELQVSGSKFKMPKFGISMPKVKGPEIDLSLSKKDIDVTLPEAKAEVKLPSVEVKEHEAVISAPDAPTVEVETKMKRPNWTFPKFSFSRTGGKAPDVDVKLETPKVDVALPEAKAEVELPDVKIKQPSATVEIKAPDIEAQTSNVEGSPSKLKMPTFTLPKFGAATPKVSVEGPDVDKDIKIKGATVDVTAASIETEGLSVDMKAKESDLELSGSKFKMPKFGISMPKVKGPEIDLSLSKKDVDVTLPEAKAEVELPDVKIKQPSATVDIKALEIEAKTGNVERSPSKLKMPTFTLPKFGAATPKVSVEVPDVDKDIQIEGATVDVTAPSIDTEDLSVDMKSKESEIQVSGSKFKMPKFGISMSKVKGPEIDLSLSKKDGDVTLPEAKAEVKLPSVEVKEHEAVISAPDAPTVEVETEMKRPNWTFPKLSFSSTGGKAPDVDDKLETPNVNVTPTEAKAEVQGPSGVILIEEPPAAKPDANLKKTKFSLPRFSFSKSSVKEPEVSAELPCVDVSLSEGQVIVKQSEMQIKAPELEAELDGQGSKFKFPKFGIALPKAKGPGEDLNASQEDAVITLPEVKAEVKLPQIEVKEPSASVEIKASETEAKSKDAGGSPLKFKMPTLKMSKFGAATYDITVEAPDADTDGAKLKEDVTVNIKGPSVDIKSDVSQAAITDSETPKTDTDAVGLGSPSKFQLPSFKMPKLSFSRSNPEDEHVPVDTESKADKQEMKVEPKEESKSPKVTFTSFGEILKNIDVEFDVPKTSENLETSKEVDETDEPSGEQLQAREKETKQDATKSPERTGWFKFPKFGLSSPSEPAKIPERDERKDEKSPAGETVDEEISPTCSVQSSDAFADISSAMTSEYGGFSLSSPTRVTVKYSDPTAAAGLGELHSNIITSTTKTELISVEPNLPEKITILSSGVSSSSEDTLRLESGKIHVITSNIQATPEAQHAKLLTAVQIQSAGGFPQGSEANEAASWTIEDSQSGKTTVFEKHFVRETSSERSESKETIVIRKQITRRFDSSEPISGETASSIQRLRDSMHSDKMRFFDGADE